MGRARASWAAGAEAAQIGGTPGVGNTLTATLAEGYTATGYQWKRNGVDIAGATANTYVQQAADEGTTLTCAVSGITYTAGSVVVPVPPITVTYVAAGYVVDGYVV